MQTSSNAKLHDLQIGNDKNIWIKPDAQNSFAENTQNIRGMSCGDISKQRWWDIVFSSTKLLFQSFVFVESSATSWMVRRALMGIDFYIKECGMYHSLVKVILRECCPLA